MRFDGSRRVAAVHYLGELYNYSMTESALIFTVLYSLITFGAGTPLDPPENVFRSVKDYFVCFHTSYNSSYVI